MAPPAREEIEILKVTLDPRCRRFTLKNYSNRAAREAKKWFDETLSTVKSKIPDDQILRFYEWNIKSENINLFEANGLYYDNIAVILGQDGAHWMFHSDVPMRKPLQGQGVLPLSFCGCCLNTQYTKIIETIKVFMANQGSRK